MYINLKRLTVLYYRSKSFLTFNGEMHAGNRLYQEYGCQIIITILAFKGNDNRCSDSLLSCFDVRHFCFDKRKMKYIIFSPCSLHPQRIFSLPDRAHGQGPITYAWQRAHGNYLATTGLVFANICVFCL